MYSNVKGVLAIAKYKHLVDEWRTLYESGLSMDQIARKYGVPKESVFSVFKAANIPRRAHKEKEKHKEYARQYPEWVRLYSDGTSIPDIAKMYGTDRSLVWAALKKLGVEIRPHACMEKNKEYVNYHDEWVSLYNDGLSSLEIASTYGVGCHGTVTSALAAKGVKMRSSSESNTKYTLKDHSVFDKIDSQEKAYWLGFLMADGNVTTKTEDSRSGWSLKVGLAIDDADHVYKFADFLGVESSNDNEKGVAKTEKAATVSVVSRPIVEALMGYGCTPRKSLTVTYPKRELSRRYNKDFIAGFFDGDGCVGASKRYANGGCGIHVIFTSGSYNFLMSLQKVLADEAAVARFHLMKQKECNAYHLTAYRKNDVLRIYHYLYGTATTFLERKKTKYEELLKLNNLL